MVNNDSNLEEILKPFIQRAAEAEDRLSKLEAALASKQDHDDGMITKDELHIKSQSDANNEELLRKISELQSELEATKAKLVSEQESARKLTAENMKLENRVIHLLRSAKELTDWKEKSGHYS